MPDNYWSTALLLAESYVTGDTDRRELLTQARDRLERVERHERWGCSAQEYAQQASELLRRAGLPELADECGDEFGIDAAALLREIDRELER